MGHWPVRPNVLRASTICALLARVHLLQVDAAVMKAFMLFFFLCNFGFFSPAMGFDILFCVKV